MCVEPIQSCVIDIDPQEMNVLFFCWYISFLFYGYISFLYSKLRRPHLFGVKLEKLCGAYGASAMLPAPVMSLLGKVAAEGPTALMVFRKSASAKLKKMCRERLDAGHAVDYAEMNVHVAALLLKEYLRDYPDGIIDYRLYSECLAILKVGGQEAKESRTRA